MQVTFVEAMFEGFKLEMDRSLHSGIAGTVAADNINIPYGC